MQAATIRIGTRGSPLALAQAHETRARLMAIHGLPETAFEIRIFKTTGDRILDRPLAEVGGKGLFTKELEDALLANEVDLAVHSMKDMQTALPPGLAIAATLPREDVRDAFISLRHASLRDLPQGAVVGTSSLRRAAQARMIRPDLQIVGFRGNVATRLRKLEEGEAEATFLAAAGLNRLGEAHRITAHITPEDMLPAVAQGAIGIEIRTADAKTADLVAPLNHEPTAICVAAERAMLARLEGSCRTPIAGLSRLDGGQLALDGLVLALDGARSWAARRSGAPQTALSLGVEVAEELLAAAGDAFPRV